MASDPEPTEEERRLDAVARTGLTNAADETMDRLAALVTRVLGSSVGLVSLVDDRRQFFPGQSGLPAPVSEARETPLAQSMCRTVVTSAEPLQIDHASADPRWSAHEALTVLGVESYLGFPLVDADGRVLGSLCALETTPRTWTADERQLLSDLAFGASSELRARIAVTDANRARARVELMADVSAALISTLDTDESIERMLDVIVQQFGVWAFVFIAEDDDMPAQIFASHRMKGMDDALAELRSDTGRRLAEMRRTRSVLTGEAPYVVLDLDEVRDGVARTEESAVIYQALGLGPVVIVPMALASSTIGALTIFGAPEQTFDEVDRTLALDLARRAAMAFVHGRQYDREKRVASELQQGLLPELADAPEISVDTLYAAAARGVEVGGDWYDLVAVGDGSYIATIGDVTGHSIRAAAAMGRVQTAAHIFTTSGLPPSQILGRVDAASVGLIGDLLATCLIAHLQPGEDGDWTMTVANAGHLPPVVVRPDGTAALLDVPHDPLIGLRSSRPATYRSATFTITPGTTLLLYTDGLVEHRRETLDHALQRLVDVASTLPSDELDGWCARLVQALEPDRSDDIACIALRF